MTKPSHIYERTGDAQSGSSPVSHNRESQQESRSGFGNDVPEEFLDIDWSVVFTMTGNAQYAARTVATLVDRARSVLRSSTSGRTSDGADDTGVGASGALFDFCK